MAHRQLIYKKPEVDLKRKYPRWLEKAFIVAILLVTSLFFAFDRAAPSRAKLTLKQPPIIIDAPPITNPPKPPPRPEPPKVPVESEDALEEPDDFPYDSLYVAVMDDWQQLAPPDEAEPPTVKIHELSEVPVVTFRVATVYPEIAKKVHVEGTVVVKVLIGIAGEVEKTEVLKSHPLLDSAAIEAASQFRFTPAWQRDRLVKVWMAIPFQFRLR